ncbi:pseudouridine synthase [Marinobacterium jannaschii]|uniref:pseudouridine synthase n=1 Tax=Marinobacterium jannaschii TaxID=64970 RepID=UPI000485C83D|nr:pseudouridine synthase [Marinobacterium jannaschii]
MTIEVLYSDSSLVVVNKPCDMLSVPGRGPDKQDCLIKRIQQQFPTARIVHRLDYATSGVMVLALSAASHRALSIAFQNRQTDKAYQAVVAGEVRESHGEIELPLICDWEKRPLQKVCYEHGKAALTRWQRLDSEAGNSRLKLIPVTGRSHQLRVHSLEMGHPIIGDRFYAPPEIQQQSPRLLLHAEYLQFPHPDSGEAISIEAPCPF